MGNFFGLAHTVRIQPILEKVLCLGEWWDFTVYFLGSESMPLIPGHDREAGMRQRRMQKIVIQQAVLAFADGLNFPRLHPSVLRSG